MAAGEIEIAAGENAIESVLNSRCLPWHGWIWRRLPGQRVLRRPARQQTRGACAA